MEWMGLVARRSFPVPSEGDTGRAFYRVTVWVLSWIYNLGECFMSFSPPPPSFLQPHAPFSAFPPPPLLSFQVTQSLHCTQGVVITGAAEIGQDKGTLPAQDVFPLSSLFFQPTSSLSFLVFPSLLMSSNSLFFAYLLHTFHSCFFHTGSFPSPYIKISVKAGPFFQWKNKPLLTSYRVFVFFSLCPN